MKRCEDYTRERKSEFIMECPKDKDDGCLTVFQGEDWNLSEVWVVMSIVLSVITNEARD